MVKIKILIFLSMLIITSYADDQVLAQYEVNNFNINSQIALITQEIQEIGPTKVQIQYPGAYSFLANEIMVGINSQSSISIQLIPINAYYNYNNGVITVSLIGDSTQQSNDNVSDQTSSGSFFDYTTPESGFFSNQ